ncbi:MAG: acetamidase/formamidase family protein [Bryobacterales bacterium]|nr:acetamidase/formamidase family protein [Bryobacterales bacterium]
MKIVILCGIAAAWPGIAAEHRVVAEHYWHTFSAAHPVLLTVEPGDRIVTKTVDSAGFDFSGVRRTRTHGNPLTGPFLIKGAQQGDTLEVRIERLRLNRASGYTGYQVGVKDAAPAGVKPGADAVYKGYDTLVPWTIDLRRALVRHGRLEFAAQPMLGCMGVAPEGDYSPRSGPAGYWGGNMDYNMVREGATILLPVFHEGGLLFFGDGHALQGDGEAVGSGVETSLDVEVTVGLRKGRKLTGPRLETAEWLVSIGGKEGASLNESAAIAVRDMLHWLTEEQGLSADEAHLLIGVHGRFDVITLGGSVGLRVPRKDVERLRR